MLIPRILFLSFMTMAGTAGTAAGGLRNVTIDDRGGDETTHNIPIYLPPDKWSSGGHARPNASLAHNGTWHDATVHPGESALNVSFSFTGVALFVYCIIANTPPMHKQYFDALANYTFFLDEELVGTYTHKAEKTRMFYYNVPVYVNHTLENKSHNLSIIAYPGDQPVLLLFDYAVYTTCEGHCVSDNAPTSIKTPMRTLTPAHSMDAPTSNLPTSGSDVTSTPEPRPNVGIIVAATLAGLAVFILSGTFLLHRFRQTKSSRQEAKLWRQSRFIVQSKTCPPSEPLARGDGLEKGYSADTQTAAYAVAHDSSNARPDVGH
ncbi:hypothetical protein PC9H_006623 [Pleurotus ostreatus]|uniref:Uncharacterized protein n=1 Tax=Pleurotus ostreatus TaxID=5322 RepID=A0A8H7DT70_PLEOS|nr:uncharacterized protein PC9H_006623 [Pleurotus ostreatus]KAF7430908.1 hypothetical protein PC9H_006623 [Pleurotus ostreatus]